MNGWVPIWRDGRAWQLWTNGEYLATVGVGRSGRGTAYVPSRAPLPLDGLCYFDPPYAGTTGYNGVAPFDSNAFHVKVREWSEHCHVFVSEYNMPFGHVVFETQKAKSVAGGNGGGRVGTERLYFIAKGSL